MTNCLPYGSALASTQREFRVRVAFEHQNFVLQSSVPVMATIFVHVAAYRDAECLPTILDLFQKAAHPRNISVGLCWQFLPGVESDTLDFGSFNDRVRVVSIEAGKTGGVCWARNLAQQFFNNE